MSHDIKLLLSILREELRAVEPKQVIIEEKQKTTENLFFDVNKFWRIVKEFSKNEKITYQKKLENKQTIGVTELLDCLRKTYYFRKQYEIDDVELVKYPKGFIKSKLGYLVEKLILWIYKNQYPDLQEDVYVDLNNVVGKIDGLLHKTVIDCKFTDYESPKYKEQVMLYAYMLEKKKIVDKIERVQLIYINTNLSIQEKQWLFSDELRTEAELLFKRKDILFTCLEKDVLPEPEKERCNFCPFEKLCKADISDNKTKNTKANKKNDKYEDNGVIIAL